MAAIILSFQLLVVFFITMAILHKYGNWRKQHAMVTISVLTSWYFAFIIIFLIPLDVVLTFYLQCREGASNASVIAANATQWLLTEISLDRPCWTPSSLIPRGSFLVLWELVYWTSQILTWLILPVMQSYCKMGEFTALGKLKSALIENAIYYASYAAVFVLFLVYVAAKGFPITASNLKTICITASNTWGLFWLVILLGYGLVEIPRKLWLTSSVKNYSLQKVYFDVEKLSADRNDADETLRESSREVKSALENLRDEPKLHYYAEIIMKQFPDFLVNDRRPTAHSSSSYRVSAHSFDEKSLSTLHRRVIEAAQAHYRYEAQWAALINKAFHLEDVASNQNRMDKVFLRSTKRPMGFLATLFCVPRVEWIWECMFKRPLLKALAAFCALMSVIIVWCEVTFFSSKPVLSIAAIFIHIAADHSDYNFIEVASILIIFYLCVCAYYTVFRIRIYRYYNLDPHHNSDENSLIFSAMVFCRLTPPLCLNFLGMIHMDSHVTGIPMSVETAYTSFMGHMDVVAFIAKGFNVYFPMAILVFCLATYFRLAARFLHYIGVEQFIDDDEMTSELVQGGKALVSAERNKLQRANDREAREEFWREKLSDHDPSRPLRRNLDKRSFPGGTVDPPSGPNYGDKALIVENAEPVATVSTSNDDPFTADANQWFGGTDSLAMSGQSSATRYPSSKGIFDDL